MLSFGRSAAGGIPWTLIWQDEFDEAAVDTSRWRIEDRHLVKNAELQYYAPDDVYLEDGCLVLRSQARPYCGYDNRGRWGCYDYTSGLVESRNRFSTTYGRIEVCAQLPHTQGLWPAHWMLPTSGSWPPEIDIMELLGDEPTRVYMTHHWGSWPNVRSEGGEFDGPDFSQGFHTFAIEWFADRIYWYVDDVVRFTSTEAIPQEPFYIILNTAVGGTWPGNPDATTVFPQYHRIDYVRVFSAAGAAEPAATITDTTGASAICDGTIATGEYVASIPGINGGLGDRIGAGSRLHVDSSRAGRVHLAFESANAWPNVGPYGAVVYFDVRAGGFGHTVNLQDAATLTRRLASGIGLDGAAADLYFPPDYQADYALALAPGEAALFELAGGSLGLLASAPLGAGGGDAGLCYRLDDGSAGGRIREVAFDLDMLGRQPGARLDSVVTMLNGDTAFRTNEFFGVAPGNAWDAVNPGLDVVVLKPGDMLRLDTVPRLGDFDRDGVVEPDDLAQLDECLAGPAGSQAAPADACLAAFDAEDDADIDLADFSIIQAVALQARTRLAGAASSAMSGGQRNNLGTSALESRD